MGSAAGAAHCRLTCHRQPHKRPMVRQHRHRRPPCAAGRCCHRVSHPAQPWPLLRCCWGAWSGHWARVNQQGRQSCSLGWLPTRCRRRPRWRPAGGGEAARPHLCPIGHTHHDPLSGEQRLAAFPPPPAHQQAAGATERSGQPIAAPRRPPARGAGAPCCPQAPQGVEDGRRL